MSTPFTPSTCEFSFPSSLEATQSLLDWFERQQPAGLDPLLWIQAKTALVEGFTNAVRHAHGPLVPPPSVKVSLSLTPTHLQLHIHDQGVPFDITNAWANVARTPDQDSNWGLIMLCRLHRDFGWLIRYDHLPNGGNRLVMKRALNATTTS
jgi:serine/threonine-protein kinase RsbW